MLAGRGAIRFVDIARRSNIAKTNNDIADGKLFPQPICGGVAILDCDNDGLMGIFFTNGAKLPELKKTEAKCLNRLYRNVGDGRFEDVTTKAGLAGENLGFSFGVAAADYDSDGHTDSFIAGAGKNRTTPRRSTRSHQRPGTFCFAILAMEKLKMPVRPPEKPLKRQGRTGGWLLAI